MLAAALPLLLILAVANSPASGGGPPFIDLIRRNGLFAPLAALAVVQPFSLPLAAGLLAGDSVAGEATAGTLRYLLVRPVGRVRLVLEKYLATLALLGLGILWMVVVASVAGWIWAGFGDFPTLSGTVLSMPEALGRVAMAAAYVLTGVAGVAAIGVLFSTLTDSGPGATAATVALVVVTEIMSVLPALEVVHPYLLSTHWLAFVDLFRDPIAWDALRTGLFAEACYVVVPLALAVARFVRKDIAS